MVEIKFEGIVVSGDRGVPTGVMQDRLGARAASFEQSKFSRVCPYTLYHTRTRRSEPFLEICNATQKEAGNAKSSATMAATHFGARNFAYRSQSQQHTAASNRFEQS